MQTNQPHDRRNPVFIGVFAFQPIFYVKRTGQKVQIGAAMCSEHARTRNACTHATHASAHERTPTRQRTRQRTHMHTRAHAHMRTRVTHATHAHAHARARDPRRPPRRQSGTGGTSARAPSAKQTERLHPCLAWSEPCKRGVTDKERITQGTMHTAKRNDRGYYRGTRYCLSRKIFWKILESQ